MTIQELVQQVLDGAPPSEVVEGWYKDFVTPVKKMVKAGKAEIIGREKNPRSLHAMGAQTLAQYGKQPHFSLMARWAQAQTGVPYGKGRLPIRRWSELDTKGRRGKMVREPDPITGSTGTVDDPSNRGRGLRVIGKPGVRTLRREFKTNYTHSPEVWRRWRESRPSKIS
jgi:hypothetical protein